MAEINTKRGSGKFTASITGATQTDGALTVDVGAGSNSTFWQIAVEVSEVPTGGSLTVSVKPFGANEFVDLLNPPNLADAPLIVTDSHVIEAIRVTPTNFDADKTYSLYITGI